MKMNSILVKNLYKEQLKIARYFGYVFGSHDNKLLMDYREINVRKMTKLYEQNKLGPVLAENIKFHFKIAKKENDMTFVEKLIDKGFSVLKTLNAFKEKSKRIRMVHVKPHTRKKKKKARK